jgi:hypothetical protein
MKPLPRYFSVYFSSLLTNNPDVRIKNTPCGQTQTYRKNPLSALLIVFYLEDEGNTYLRNVTISTKI